MSKGHVTPFFPPYIFAALVEWVEGSRASETFIHILRRFSTSTGWKVLSIPVAENWAAGQRARHGACVTGKDRRGVPCPPGGGRWSPAASAAHPTDFFINQPCRGLQSCSPPACVVPCVCRTVAQHQLWKKTENDLLKRKQCQSTSYSARSKSPGVTSHVLIAGLDELIVLEFYSKVNSVVAN